MQDVVGINLDNIQLQAVVELPNQVILNREQEASRLCFLHLARLTDLDDLLDEIASILGKIIKVCFLQNLHLLLD